MAAPKKPTHSPKGKSGSSKGDPDSRLLASYQHHTAMAEKHRAHADLVRAKLRVQGKEIDEYGSSTPSPAIKKAKPRVVKRNG